MNQFFNLVIAAETLEKDAQQLDVTVEALQRICVKVNAKIVRQPVLQLQLTYQITLPSQILANQLVWPTWQQARVGFADYLWEETCLECFITGDTLSDEAATEIQDAESYIEINANPDGRYALYEFKSYRHPATLPPTPLYKADGHTCASIEWTDNINTQDVIQKSLFDKSPAAYSIHRYERGFNVPLIELPNQKYAIANTIIEQIHPCVILQLGKTALYFASQHASPPDFHNRNYWPKFAL
ncbi:hypothetical protein ACQKCW_09160 [Psychrobacter pacificensis]|uniref:hypothetical protein n=1 Tax=Psychrobacter pacificensis TaxID=112002 RepID=UPI003D02CE6E